MEPETRYARTGGIAIAYQVVGDGDVDLVYVPDYVSNLGYVWGYPRWRDFYLRLSGSFRLILFDKRGTGLSDHGGGFAALETSMEDLHSVLDAAGSQKTVILGSHEGCGMAALFAATYPERTRALVLFHPELRGILHKPGALPEAGLRELQDLRDRWGSQEFADELLRDGCQTLYASEEDRRQFARYLRIGATPAVAYALNRAFYETDMTDVLPAIHLSPEIADEIELFVSDDVPPAVPERVLATLVFTDIVGSTEQTAAIGDAGWRALLAQHHSIVRRELNRFHGVEYDTAATGSSHRSTAPRGRSGAPRRSTRRLRRSTSMSASGSTSASASSTTASRRGSQSPRPRASARSQAPVTCSYRRRCATSSPAPASSSRIAAVTR